MRCKAHGVINCAKSACREERSRHESRFTPANEVYPTGYTPGYAGGLYADPYTPAAERSAPPEPTRSEPAPSSSYDSSSSSSSSSSDSGSYSSDSGSY